MIIHTLLLKTSIHKVLNYNTGFLFILFTLLTSCNNIENENRNEKYLDIEFQNFKAFTPLELNIIYMAIQRVEQHVTYDGENKVINIKSANEVNISDKLFDYVSRSITTSHLNYRNDSFQRIKTRASESFSSGFGYYQWTAELNHDETITLLNTAQTELNRAGFAASIASSALNPCIGLLVGMYTFVNSEYWSKKEDEYLKSNKNGCKIIQTIYTATSAGGGYTTYQFIFL